MKYRQKYLFFVTVFMVLLPLSGFSILAQEKKEPASRVVVIPPQSDVPLPKIDLPEYEILGTDVTELPAAGKPVADEEIVFEPAERTPGEKPRTSGIHFPPVRPEKELQKPEGTLNGLIKGSFGLYGSPSIDGWFGKNYTGGGMQFHAQHHSTAGHIDNAGEQQTGIIFNGSMAAPKWIGSGADGSISGECEFSGGTYHAYGSAFPSSARIFNKSKISLELASSIERLKFFPEAVQYAITTGWNKYSISDSNEAAENRFTISGSAFTPLAGYDAGVSVEYAGSFVHSPNQNLQNPLFCNLGFSASRWFNTKVFGNVYLREYLMRGGISPLRGRLYPSAELKLLPATSVSISCRMGARIDQFSFSDIFAKNKYTVSSIYSEPAEIPLFLSAQGMWSIVSRHSINGEISYSQVNNFPVFFEIGNAKVWEVMYLPNVSILEGKLSADAAAGAGVGVNLWSCLRSAQWKDSAAAIPYLPSFETGIKVQKKFINERFTLTGRCSYIGERGTSIMGTEKLSQVFLFSADGVYEINENFRGGVTIENIFNRRYQMVSGYDMRPFFLAIQLHYRW